MSYAISREAWLKERCKGIGGSDAAAVLGLSRYKSPLEVYLNKIGEGVEVESTERMAWGLKLERLILEEYGTRSGCSVKHNEDQSISCHHSHDWFICTVDGFAWKDKNETSKGVVECKNIDKWSADEWKDGHVPDEYLIQLQHNIGVTGCTWGVLCALIGGNHFEYYEFDRDDELIKLIMEKEFLFWSNNVLKHIPPDPTGASLDILGKLYNKDNGTSIELQDDKIGSAIASYLEAKIQLDHYKAIKDDAQAIIQSAMGEASKGIYQTPEMVWGVSWSSVKGRLGFDVKTFEKEYPDLYLKFMKTGESYRRFQIKGKNIQSILPSKQKEIS